MTCAVNAGTGESRTNTVCAGTYITNRVGVVPMQKQVVDAEQGVDDGDAMDDSPVPALAVATADTKDHRESLNIFSSICRF